MAAAGLLASALEFGRSDLMAAVLRDPTRFCPSAASGADPGMPGPDLARGVAEVPRARETMVLGGSGWHVGGGGVVAGSSAHRWWWLARQCRSGGGGFVCEATWGGTAVGQRRCSPAPDGVDLTRLVPAAGHVGWQQRRRGRARRSWRRCVCARGERKSGSQRESCSVEAVHGRRVWILRREQELATRGLGRCRSWPGVVVPGAAAVAGARGAVPVDASVLCGARSAGGGAHGGGAFDGGQVWWACRHHCRMMCDLGGVKLDENHVLASCRD
ncbi:hypothetical protein D1007_23638 [Hordeum vulgare]|nr:hypothetical protein D1007_23638 [Hordeum vulgare]